MMKIAFLAMAAYLAWRAFKYSHFVERTNRENKRWLDEWYPECGDNAEIADRHRRSMIFDYVAGALACALIAYCI